MTNRYCRQAGIEVPSLAKVKDHREAGPFSLLLVALLEHGGPLTLDQAAARFAEAGVAPPEQALRSLKRCRPGRPPVYRDGDLYGLDPHDDELDLWLFRLGLRSPRVPQLTVVRPDPVPLPDSETALSPEELQEAFGRQRLLNWSAQRLALAVLDVHGGSLAPGRVAEILDGLAAAHGFSFQRTLHWRSGAVLTDTNGNWRVDPDHGALSQMRNAVRQQIERVRSQKAQGQDPVAIAARIKAADRHREAGAERLARLRRVLLHGYPPEAPRGLVLLDIKERELTTLLEPDLPEARQRLAGYDYIAAVGVRPLLRAIGFDPEDRRLAELGPPQKTVTLDSRGRVLKITTEMLIRGSCRIGKPLGDPKALDRYLRDGETGRLRRRLEADAKALFALYSYGMLHHGVRLGWGFLDMMLRVPWVHPDEPNLQGIMREAFEEGRDLEVVVGAAPGWGDPWARGRRCVVLEDERGWGFLLVDEEGRGVLEEEVQMVRGWGRG